MGRTITTPEFRVMYPKVFEAEAYGEGQPTYSLLMLFDKDTDISELKKIASEACNEEFGANVAKITKNPKFWVPFRDGDTEKPDVDGFQNCIFIRAKRVEKIGAPQLIDISGNAIIDPNKFYSGCYARATISANAYNVKGGTGVSFWLNSLLKTRDGERLTSGGSGGSNSAKNDFKDFLQATESTEETSNDDMFN